MSKKKNKAGLFSPLYELSAASDAAAVHIYGSDYAEVEGAKSILQYSGQRVVFNMGAEKMSIEAENIVLEKLTRTALTVRGKISKIEFVQRTRSNDK